MIEGLLAVAIGAPVCYGIGAAIAEIKQLRKDLDKANRQIDALMLAFIAVGKTVGNMKRVAKRDEAGE